MLWGAVGIVAWHPFVKVDIPGEQGATWLVGDWLHMEDSMGDQAGHHLLQVAPVHLERYRPACQVKGGGEFGAALLPTPASVSEGEIVEVRADFPGASGELDPPEVVKHLFGEARAA